MKSTALAYFWSFIFALILSFLVSCQPAQQHQDQKDVIHLTIDPARLPPIAKLTEIAQSIRIVPLETNPGCLIGSIQNLYAGKNSILVSTSGGGGKSGGESKLLHFTSGGKFLNNIGRVGKGPGEYSDVNDMSVFENPLRVMIYPSRMLKILEYSFNGTLNREIPFGNGLNNCRIFDGNRSAFTSYIDYKVNIINAKTSDTARYIKVTKETQSGFGSLEGSPLTGFFYTGVGMDTIWRIDQDSMRPKIICNFGSGHYSTQDYMRAVIQGLNYPPGKLIIGVGRVLSGSGYYQFLLTRENEQKSYIWAHVMINESENKSWHLEEGLDSDDILFCTSKVFMTVASSGEWVSVVGAGELIEALPKIKANRNFSYPPELITQIEKMTVEDNPVIVFYTLK
jgi:hypothetical protein